jgi:hypothetical protein
MASLEEIAGLKAQIAALSRDNDQLRVSQVNDLSVFEIRWRFVVQPN